MKRKCSRSSLFVCVALALLLQGQTCERGDTYLLSLRFEVLGRDLVPGFNINNRTGYSVTTTSSTAILTVDTREDESTANYEWKVDGTTVEAAQIGLGGGSVVLSIPVGQSALYVSVRAAEGNVGGYWVDVERIDPCVSLANGTLCEFDDGVAGMSLDAYYASRGVTFSDTEWVENGVGEIYDDVGQATAPLSISNNGYRPTQMDPLIATFLEPQTSVSILAVNVGQAGGRLDAYDAVVGGSLVGSAEGYGTTVLGEIKPEGSCAAGPCWHEERLLAVSAASIRRIEVYRPGGATDGVHFDNLTFEPGCTDSNTNGVCDLAE